MFLDFISYSDGPLPDELLEATRCPVSILWGEKDPWEPIAAGRKFQRHPCVEEFIPLPGQLHLSSRDVLGLAADYKVLQSLCCLCAVTCST